MLFIYRGNMVKIRSLETERKEQIKKINGRNIRQKSIRKPSINNVLFFSDSVILLGNYSSFKYFQRLSQKPRT